MTVDHSNYDRVKLGLQDGTIDLRSLQIAVWRHEGLTYDQIGWKLDCSSEFARQLALKAKKFGFPIERPKKPKPEVHKRDMTICGECGTKLTEETYIRKSSRDWHICDVCFREHMNENQKEHYRKKRQEGTSIYLRHPGNKYYSLWYNMMQRCNNPSTKYYRRYGGRGIVVCERWHKFETFVDDLIAEIGLQPDEHTLSGRAVWTLDRINNDGNYESGNVRWATQQQQMSNADFTSRSHNSTSHATRLNWEKVREIRRRYAAGDRIDAIANAFGIGYAHCHKICKDKMWREFPSPPIKGTG